MEKNALTSWYACRQHSWNAQPNDENAWSNIFGRPVYVVHHDLSFDDETNCNSTKTNQMKTSSPCQIQ
jgi:hypothetical protein